MDNVDDIYPLTPSQAGILYHTLRSDDPALYFEQVRADLEGELDVAVLKDAWVRTFERHAALRTVFVWQGLDAPLQVVRSTVEIPWVEIDLRSTSADDIDRVLSELCEAEKQQGIDLSRAPTSRFLLARVGESAWHFVWNFHHISLDGWSVVRVFNEAVDAYLTPEVEPPEPPAFKQHVEWLMRHDAAETEEFWRERLAGFESATPIRFGRIDDGAEFALGRLEFDLTRNETADIVEFARNSRVTVNTLVQAAWSIVLGRYSGEGDVVFGVTMAGRPAELDGVEDIIGMFLSTLPMRIEPESEMPIDDWLRSVQTQQLEMLAHQHSSLADVHRWSDIAPGTELFESILVFENYPIEPPVEHGSIRVTRGDVFEQSHYPLTVMVRPGDPLGFTVLYDRARFLESEVAQLIRHLGNALVQIAASRSASAGGVSVMTDGEISTVVDDWNRTDRDHQLDRTVNDLFADVVSATPDATALIFEGRELTFGELDQRSSALAHLLVGRGVGPEVPVGVSIQRSFEMVIAVVAVVKAGGAYVPLDPLYPADRLALIVEDSAMSVVVATSKSADLFNDIGVEVVDLDQVDLSGGETPPLRPEIGPGSTVVIPFTSGSTGRPKGVRSHHRGVVNRVLWQAADYPVAADEVLCQKTTLSFVDHLWELWGGLLLGRTQVLVPDEVLLDSDSFIDLLAAHRIRRVVLVPSYIRVLLETHPDMATRLPDLIYWTFSGERTPGELADRFRRQMPHAVLLNFYGMSEATLDVAHYDDRWDAECASVPIGRPIDNCKAYVLDAKLRPVPIGVAGEIYASGVVLANGYWRRDDLTANVFFQASIAGRDPVTIYRTGDVGRWLPSGHLECLGRNDHQVKIRGVRIELGEVESTVREDPSVSEAVVVLVGVEGHEQLVAYVTAAPGAVVEGSLIVDRCRATLSSQMTPSMVVVLDEFPRTPSGKLDRRSLPEPGGTAAQLGPGRELSPAEEQMLTIWQEALGDHVGIDDDFFDVGGHSLLALKLIARIKNAFDSDVQLATLFERPTAAALAQLVSGTSVATQGLRHLVEINTIGEGLPTIYCVHGAGGNVMNMRAIGELLEGEWNVIGIQAAGVDGVAEVHGSVAEFCDAYLEEVGLRQPEGPYVLAGYSAGGVIAHEMAARLEALGEDVLAVLLFDTTHPSLARSRFPTARRMIRIATGGIGTLRSRLSERSARHRRLKVYSAETVDTAADSMPIEYREARLREGLTSAVDGFETSPFSGRVALFAAEHIDWAYEREGETRGWAPNTVDLSVHVVPGRHADLLLGDNANRLVEAIRLELEPLMADHLSRRGSSAAQ